MFSEPALLCLTQRKPISSCDQPTAIQPYRGQQTGVRIINKPDTLLVVRLRMELPTWYEPCEAANLRIVGNRVLCRCPNKAETGQTLCF